MNVPGSNGTVISVCLRTIHGVSRFTLMNNSRNYPGKATNPTNNTFEYRATVGRLSISWRFIWEKKFFSAVSGQMQFYFSILLIQIHAVNTVLFFSLVWQTSKLSGILQAQELYWWFFILCNCYSEMKV